MALYSGFRLTEPRPFFFRLSVAVEVLHIAGLVADSGGNLYGTTLFGGKKCVPGGCGTVFRLAPDGAETVLHAFSGRFDGKFPRARMAMDGTGNLYGTTSEGGEGCPPNRDGCGTVFKIAPDGTESILYAFHGGSDGSNPTAGLILDDAGNLYGTTLYGGAFGDGVVFALAPDGVETVLHLFTGGISDGAGPTGSLVSDDQGNLFGVTEFGGGSGCESSGCGTVFKITPQGEESVLHAFGGGSDGTDPVAGLFRDRDGQSIWNDASTGGNTGCEDQSRMRHRVQACTGWHRKLFCYTFSGNEENGAITITAALVADSNGNLYGTTWEVEAEAVMVKFLKSHRNSSVFQAP